jgi:tripartite-type tricarboxylate transporter receptor subunit TctC
MDDRGRRWRSEKPYRGAAQAVTDLLSGRLDGLFGDVPTVIAQVRAGKLKPIFYSAIY